MCHTAWGCPTSRNLWRFLKVQMILTSDANRIQNISSWSASFLLHCCDQMELQKWCSDKQCRVLIKIAVLKPHALPCRLLPEKATLNRISYLIDLESPTLAASVQHYSSTLNFSAESTYSWITYSYLCMLIGGSILMLDKKWHSHCYDAVEFI